MGRPRDGYTGRPCAHVFLAEVPERSAPFYTTHRYLANVQEQGFDNNPLPEGVKRHAAREGSVVRGTGSGDRGARRCGKARISGRPEARRTWTPLEEQAYESKHLFQARVQEVRAWTIPVGATAPEAAGVIHTDFQKGFIRAGIISYRVYIEFKGEQGAKDARKWRLEGKDYVMQDGDVAHFRINV